jgi:hypothetical protein
VKEPLISIGEKENSVSTVHAFWKGVRQSESALISAVAPKKSWST